MKILAFRNFSQTRVDPHCSTHRDRKSRRSTRRNQALRYLLVEFISENDGIIREIKRREVRSADKFLKRQTSPRARQEIEQLPSSHQPLENYTASSTRLTSCSSGLV